MGAAAGSAGRRHPGRYGALSGWKGGLIVLVVMGALLSATAPRATADGPYACVPENVAVFQTRIQMRCATPTAAGIAYFATPTAERDHANRILALLLAAETTGATVGIYYVPDDLSAAAIGCNNADCALIDWVFLLPPP
jgi:hypothetical protein